MSSAAAGTAGITLLGATGSIGMSTVDVIRRHPDRFHVTALVARSQVARMAELCVEFQPRYAVMEGAAQAGQLRELLQQRGCRCEVLSGVTAMEQVAAATETQLVVAAIVGAAGLLPTLAAARAGKRILLANKEALVMSGQLFMDTVRANAAVVLPVDSEHNAIFQCMPADATEDIQRAGVERILLTASGGPFHSLELSKLETVTPEQACKHPNWVMGRKISVDSASMMNKGLEVIEACWLFNARVDQIQVVIHRQSVIHSMVQYRDGSVLAQLGNPDMRIPIANALAWPERIDSGVAALDIFQVAHLDFAAPDLGRYPCLGLAMQAARAGGTAPAVLNAANEIAVGAFLDKKIRFTQIATVVEDTMGACPPGSAQSLEAILAADEQARAHAMRQIHKRG